MRLITQESTRTLRIPLRFVGLGALALVTALAVYTAMWSPSSLSLEGEARVLGTPAWIFDDPIRFHAAWYPPYAQDIYEGQQPIAAPTPSIFDDPIAFHAAWYPPYPQNIYGDQQPIAAPTPSILDDPIAFHAAWYPPYP